MATLPAPSPLQTEIPTQSADPESQSVVSGSRRSAPSRPGARLTVKLLESLRSGDIVRDTGVRGLYAECGARGVSLKIAGDLERGRTVRMTLGKFPELDLAEARLQAARLLAEIKAGRDPRAATALAAAPGVLTVGGAVDRYLADMAKRNCAAKTIQFTGSRLRTHLSELLALPIVDVKPSHCITAHDRISASAGKVAANKALRDLRAVWNLAVRQSDHPERFPRNCPVASVTMHAESKRENATVTDLPGWWRRTGELSNPLRTCLHRLGVLSGLRPGNLAGIRREWLCELDGAAPAIRFPANAMKARVPFTLPLSSPMVALVQRALELGPALVSVPDAAGWLFPTRSRDGRSVVATSNWGESSLASNECGHALRHTYSTLARAARVAASDVELLLAHAVPGVAGIYMHQDHAVIETHLRAQQQRISAFILEQCGVTIADVVPTNS